MAHIEHRGKDRHGRDSWAIRAEAGRDDSGKRKRSTTSVHGTRKEAEVAWAQVLLDGRASVNAASGLTCQDFLSRWLEHARTTTAASTYRRYKQIVEKELIPAFGGTRLTDLTAMQIQTFLGRSLARKRRRKSGGDLSARTVLHFFRVLKRALGQAVKWGLIPRNPCDLVDPPRPEQVEMKALDERQLLSLLAAIRQTRHYVAVLLAALTGMRLGELLALKWSDIDLDCRECQVVRSVQRTDEGLSFKSPKTRRSRRTILLPEMAVTALKAHRAQQNEERLLMGPGYQDLDLVFARPDGSIWPPMQFSGDFRRLIRRRGFNIRFHDLRHTHASQLLKAGVPVKVVSERLGHATASITLDVYSHVLPGMQAEAVAKIDAALGKAIGK